MLNPMDLTGRRILVTGASSGIGRCCAIILSKLGANVVLVARRRELLEETRHLMEGTGHQIADRDLLDVDAIPKWMKDLTAAAGPLHGVVHSAGTLSILPLRAMSTAKLDEIMRLNFTAAVMLAKGFRQRGVVAQPGSIVFIGSVAGLSGQSGLSAYCASKGALISVTRTLALELAEENIRVNTLAPGLVATDIAERAKTELPDARYGILTARHPLGVGQPEDVAHATAFLLSDAGRWITGTTMVVDGGFLANGI